MYIDRSYPYIIIISLCTLALSKPAICWGLRPSLSLALSISTLLPKTWPRSHVDHEFCSILRISQSLNILTIITWYWWDLCESVLFQGIHWLIVMTFSRSGILMIHLRSVCIINLGNDIDVYSPGTFWGGIIERDDRTGGTFVWWGYLEYWWVALQKRIDITYGFLGKISDIAGLAANLDSVTCAVVSNLVLPALGMVTFMHSCPLPVTGYWA